MGMTPEGKVKKAVKDYLKGIDAWYYMPVSNGMGRVGCPDIIACVGGAFIAIETKAPGKRGSVTPNQQREIDGIISANGLAFVVDDVEQLKEALNDQIFSARVAHQSSVQQTP